MYDGPNYNPPDVQSLAPGAPPWVQQQIKATRDAAAAAWYALEEQKKGKVSNGYQQNPEALAAEGRAWMAFILYVLFGRLGRYVAKRILRDRTPPVTEPAERAVSHGIPQPPTPLLQSQGFRVYCAIIALLFGSATLGALAYGAPVMAFMWGFLLVSLIGLPFIVAGLRQQWRSGSRVELSRLLPSCLEFPDNRAYPES